MKISTLFMASSFLLAFFAVGAKSASLSPNSQQKLLNRIAVRSLATLKSSELALEKCSAAYLRETIEQLHQALSDELSHLLMPSSDNSAENEALTQQLNDLFEQSREFQFHSTEFHRFDEEFVDHQLNETASILDDLKRLAKSSEVNVRNTAKRNRELFTWYRKSLQHFEKNFLAVDEHRIRDIAHQIWESEGRPEGQAVRHWAMAVELSKKLTLTELKTAFEQHQSVAELLASTRFDRNNTYDRIH